LKILQSKYTAILQSFPNEYSQTLQDLQDDLTPECIFAILSDETSAKLANKMMLDCMIAKISCKEGILDLCDQLEKISNAPKMSTVVSQLRSGKTTYVHYETARIDCAIVMLSSAQLSTLLFST